MLKPLFLRYKYYILALILPLTPVIYFTIVYSFSWSPPVSAITTIILAVIALFAGFLALKQLEALNNQTRINSFITLLAEWHSARQVENRRIIYQVAEQNEWKWKIESVSAEAIKCIIETGRNASNIFHNQKHTEDKKRDIRIFQAFEETIYLLDKISYFLINEYGDIKQRPKWIDSVARNIWSIVGLYINEQQKENPSWAISFKEYVKEQCYN